MHLAYRTALFCFMTLLPLVFASHGDAAQPTHASVVNSSASQIAIEFSSFDVQVNERPDGDARVLEHHVMDEGVLQVNGMPVLPAVTRFIVVPPGAGLSFHAEAGSSQRRKAENSPQIFRDGNKLPAGSGDIQAGVFPSEIAEMSEPFVIRGARLVKVTSYPVQYDFETGEFIYNENITATIEYTDKAPLNPVEYPVRKHRSRHFLNYIRNLALNGDEVGSDDPDCGEPPPYTAHYLVVIHRDCLPYAIPFIEWRRQSGFKVDILSLTPNAAGNENTVKDSIQDRYDAYLQARIDPFDHILLIGDRTHYFYTREAQWILKPPRGNPTWGNDNHADYLFACLEGSNNDQYPDAAFSRWHSGNPDAMALAVGRTLGYEMTPYMEDTEWFTRGGTYSQHWGNSPNAWHVSINSNARWGEEVLKSRGFEDVGFYEDYEWDRQGNRIGPVIQNWLNDGLNVMVGRAENYFWDGTPAGNGDFDRDVDENNVFPINLCHSGHGEWCAEAMTRRGSGDDLKGAVAMTYGWGNPRYTAPISACWMECVSGIIMNDMTLGWGRVFGITAIEKYFAGGAQYILTNRTEFDCFGDPAIQPWIGVPSVYDFEYPSSVSPDASLVEVRVFDPENDGAGVGGVQVTLYEPGEVPDDEDYAEFEAIFSATKKTAADGVAGFIISDENRIEPGTMQVTVTGRNVLPLFGAIEIAVPEVTVEIEDYELDQVEGNNDNRINPGESFSLCVTAVNSGTEQAAEDVSAVITSDSPWLEIENGAMEFGTINPGETAEGNGNVLLRFDPSLPDGSVHESERPLLKIVFTDGETGWQAGISLDAFAPHFTITRIPDGIVVPDTLYDLRIELGNNGRIDSPPLRAELISLSIGIGVVAGEVWFPAIEANEVSYPDDDDVFVVRGNSLVPPGSSNKMMLILANEDDFIDTVYFYLQVMEEHPAAPQGPDEYGYICFDDTDTSWAVSPDFDWVEISLDEDERDFDGRLLDFSGRSLQDVGESIVVDLPFETQFYGNIYDQVTVCTNGYIAMGEQPRITNFQNWPMDRAIGGGVGMIAPFWDWLSLGDEGGIYHYHDRENSRFIIEWYKLRHHQGGDSDLRFQVILYDHDVWITESGDQNIFFQYYSITQARGQQNGAEMEWNVPFASVGISSPPISKQDRNDGKTPFTTGISYTFKNEYPVTSAPLQDQRAILFSTSPKYKACILYGSVTDFETGMTIERAGVVTSHGFATFTDNLGNWRIPGALAEVSFELRVFAEGYNDSTRQDLEVVEGDSLEVNFSLLHSEFELSNGEIHSRLRPEETVDISVTLSNDGNGPLTWSSERRFEEENADIGRRIGTFIIGPMVQDLGLEGVAFANNRFYVSGQNGNDPNLIYIFDTDGNYTGHFEQPGDSRNGIADMTWDGELLWGSGERAILGFDLEGNLERSFVGPFSNNRVLAYDPHRDAIWATSPGNPIIAVGFDGNRVTAVNSNQLRISGMIYRQDDPDGYYLYVLHNPGLNDLVIHKINPESGEMMLVTELDSIGTGQPGGMFLAEYFDPYGTALMVLINDYLNVQGDRIGVWQIGTYKGWFDLSPDEGRLLPQSRTDLTVSLDAVGLIPSIYEMELVFHHSASQRESVIEVTLEVTDPNYSLEKSAELPGEFGLTAAYPNPFNGFLQVSFQLAQAGNVTLVVLDLAGRVVATPFDGFFAVGKHQVTWKAQNLPSGVYVIELRDSRGSVDFCRALLLR